MSRLLGALGRLFGFDELRPIQLTEAQWLVSDDSYLLLGHLEGTFNSRKRNLIACAVCRYHREHIDDLQFHYLIDLADQVVDGKAMRHEFANAWHAQFEELTANRRLPRAAMWEAEGTVNGQIDLRGPRGGPRIKAVSSTEANLIRCIVGNPFRPVSIDPAWLTWNNRTMSALAETIYTERAFDRLPILGDALEEAGCDNADILNHCRGPGPHARACWVVDLLLGK
jgi:hypothetical protein